MDMDKDFLTVVGKISEKLTAKGLKLSVAESCTGGFIANAITNLPGASHFFKLGVVSYTAEAKKEVLGVGSSFLKKHGLVSEETAVAMAQAVKKLGHTDVSLSVTGVAGPEPLEGMEIGIVYMAASVRDVVESEGLRFTGNRGEIKRKAALEALRYLNRVLDLWI
jgi:nicotinamide-nucleotide amidase